MANKAIVIGSGIAGLATAARLASKGYQVQVFEASAQPGGKLGLIGDERYRFDSGPSLFTLPQLIDQLIHDCGREPRDYFNYYQKDTACHYFWPDGTFIKAYADKEAFAEEVQSRLQVPAQKLLSYLKRSAFIYRYTEKVFLRRSLHRFKSYLHRDTLASIIRMPRLGLGGSLHRYNHKMLQHPKLVQLFDRFATYNGSDPFQTPGVMSSIPHLEHNIGTFYPKGGMHQIARSIYQLALDLGVEFHFNTKVERILSKNAKAYAVQVGNEIHEADVIISNMDVVPTYRYLMPQEKAPEKTLQQERSSSALIFYWGIKKEFPQLDLHNIFFSADYEQEFKAIFQEQTIGDDPTIYLNISSKEGEGDAPEGCENWFILINAPGNTGQDWDALIPKVRRQVLDKLSASLNVDIESLIEYEDYLDPRRIESRTSSYQGSLYGAGSNDTFSAFLRHPNFSRYLQGLYFCGGSVHPGGGIPLCLMGAEITANLIEEDYAN
ncbi:1-hydroxycarotenoid 3,4-desaturase CrtD [Croceimicrobium hydrocarbonivorans]|uniref:Phytoene desaturase n=1 Tax=Croceimicrobium hydrocarbonivorans TaxID=2761580 RepID=A0A7H0VEX4_9FLAO|nr:1-hydroxycarotenoid 3,4-desaturase CrtD [Croceimicrobium hydrocarbonivorans]QNR24272.1 phytoene desaturase [Croceimicrobium hydrocarbonivorans]